MLEKAEAAGRVPPRPSVALQVLEESQTLKEGQLVVFMGSFDMIRAGRLQVGAQFAGPMGNYAHDDIIGKLSFGDKLWDRKGTSWVSILPHSSDVHTYSLNHRTQILYHADIAWIMGHMNIRHGSRIVESGTGTGSLTVSLSQAVGTTGHIYTFEYNPRRAEEAAEEFKELGLGNITVTQRNVYEEGFVPPGHSEFSVDGVFLDLPEPHMAVESAAAVLEVGGSLVVFLPCVEQLRGTIQALEALGWDSDIDVVETTNQQWQAMIDKRKADTEYDQDKPATSLPVNIGHADVWISRCAAPGHTGFLLRTHRPKHMGK